MSDRFALSEIARRPMPGDNVAIVVRRLEAGTEIVDHDHTFRLDHTLLEGHRFAVQPINPGEALLSWELPFGYATRAIAPGNYVCNEGMLAALRVRRLDFKLPAEPNFADRITPYQLDEASFRPAEPLPLYDQPRTFLGYRRTGNRGVGTRNFIVLLGTTSQTNGFVRQLEARLKGAAAGYANIDGIVAVAHTEGGSDRLNNLDFILRTLAGFVVHPNVGAVLIVDYGSEVVTNAMLERFMRDNNYPLDKVIHQFASLSSGFETSLAHGEQIVKGWLKPVNQTGRTAEPLAELKLALQCGGSDAFSGVSGNPLAAWVAKEIIRYGGAANLAETDELIGAEPYVLQKVRDLATARKFLAQIERFKERAAWHGQTVEANPSGGNKFRGLYNIALKSIGAAMKRNPDVPLDYVIDYGERMLQPGYYFMDSPGNDLESIAGQVAAGSNMIYFVTGNGSITNFPFVPTIKIVTTSARYQLLSQDMDVNAGAYLDGTPMADLGSQTLDLTVEVGSGQRSVGEKAGHAQVQLWRNWQQTDSSKLEILLNAPNPGGAGLPIKPPERPSTVQFSTFQTERGLATAQVGLILPTSLCAGQIARMNAERLNRQNLGREQGLSRFVALVHTEGCGVSGGASEKLYTRTLLGYAAHPMVKYCLLLEHGCEKTHNDYVRQQLETLGFDPQRFGWASIQLDGGIERVTTKIERWFVDRLTESGAIATQSAGLEALRIGLVSAGPISAEAAQQLAGLTRQIVAAGGAVVLPDNSGLLQSVFRAETAGDQALSPTLAYAQQATSPGFHLMEAPSTDWVETLSGLGATGVELIVAYVGQHPMQSHPMVPVIQITADAAVRTRYGVDLDLVLSGDAGGWSDQILGRLVEVISGAYLPTLYRQGNIDFQITRGLLGVSM